MKNYSKITPEGTRDLLFGECRARRKAEEAVNRVFINRGFSEIITPGIEFMDVFNKKAQSIPSEDMYKLVDNKGRLLVIRPDSTLPIARVVGTRLQSHTRPIRLFYNQSVFEVNPSMSGRNNEVIQAGIEIIGASSIKKSDLEAITIALEALESCEIDNYRLEIGHIGLFNNLVARLGLDAETSEAIRRLIEIKNYPMLNELLDSIGAGYEIECLKSLPRLFGGMQVFEKAVQQFTDEASREILDYLHSIYKAVSSMWNGDGITLDLGIVNRTDYYTGIVFRGYIAGTGEAVLSGGRYDGLLSEFGEEMPATGFALNLDSVMRTMLHKKSFSDESGDVLVYAMEQYETEGLKRASELVKTGIKAEYCLADSEAEARRYAKEKGFKRIELVSDKICSEEV